MASIQSRNKARGRAYQTKLARMCEGMNVGTLGGEDVMHKEFSYEAKTYNINAKTYKGKNWAGELAFRIFDDSQYQKSLFIVKVVSYSFPEIFMIRWKWWKELLECRLTSWDIEQAVRECRKEKFIGDRYMMQAENNCPDSKLPVVVVHTTGYRHEQDIVLVRGLYWKSLLENRT